MIDNSKEYIICAAIWYDDKVPTGTHNKEHLSFPLHYRGATFQNDNIKTGFVVGQWRHYNCIACVPENPAMNNGIAEHIQGFLTSKGRFVDRWQGMYIAYLANQVDSNRAFRNDFDNNGFDYEALLEEAPNGNRYKQTPLNMLYSEDLY